MVSKPIGNNWANVSLAETVNSISSPCKGNNILNFYDILIIHSYDK